MKNAEEHLAEFRQSFLELKPHDAVVHTQKVIIPILEDLGYRLGRESGGGAANSAFILASDLEKRLSALARAIEADEE